MLLSDRVWKQLHDLLSKKIILTNFAIKRRVRVFYKAIFKQCIKLEFGSPHDLILVQTESPFTSTE